VKIPNRTEFFSSSAAVNLLGHV